MTVIRKKNLSPKDMNWLESGELLVTERDTGEVRDAVIITKEVIVWEYLSNKKFVKRWTNRWLLQSITKNIWASEMSLLFIIQSYIDDENIIKFEQIKKDFGYHRNKMDRNRNALIQAGLVKKISWNYYLSPLVCITWDLKYWLLELFRDEINTLNYNLQQWKE